MLNVRITFVILFFSYVMVIGGVQKSPIYRRSHSTDPSNSTEFDVLIFAQSWPPTECYKWLRKSSSNTCVLPTEQTWTIHGIWPRRFGTKKPFFCNKYSVLNVSALSGIVDDLRIKWAKIHNETEEYSLWKYEWFKHGTCAQSVEKLDSEMKYFESGIDLSNRYDMRKVLEEARIYPGKKYSIQTILKELQTVLGKSCQVMCYAAKKGGLTYYYLQEIRIALDKSLELIDWNNELGNVTNCPPDKFVFFYSKMT